MRVVTWILALSAAIGLSSVPGRAATIDLGNLPNPTELTRNIDLLGASSGESDRFTFTLAGQRLVEVELFPFFDTIVTSTDVGGVVQGPAEFPAVLGFAELLGPGDYEFAVLRGFTDDSFAGYSVAVSVTPIPGAIILLAPALIGLGLLAQRRRRA